LIPLKNLGSGDYCQQPNSFLKSSHAMIRMKTKSSLRPIRVITRVVVLSLLNVDTADAAIKFDSPYSLNEGLTAPIEQPWRQEIRLNGLWQFQSVPLPADYKFENGAPLLRNPTPKG